MSVRITKMTQSKICLHSWPKTVKKILSHRKK